MGQAHLEGGEVPGTARAQRVLIRKYTDTCSAPGDHIRVEETMCLMCAPQETQIRARAGPT